MLTISEILNLFCADGDDSLPKLMKPFAACGYAAATDTTSLICVPLDMAPQEIICADDKNDLEEGREGIGILLRQEHYEKQGVLENIEDLGNIVAQNVTYQNEYEAKPCPECQGLGLQECSLGYEHECDNCAGDGFVPDYTKPAKKVIRSNYLPVTFNNVIFWVDVKHLSKIVTVLATYKDYEWTAKTKGRTDAIFFRCANGIVLALMPCNPQGHE